MAEVIKLLVFCFLLVVSAHFIWYELIPFMINNVVIRPKEYVWLHVGSGELSVHDRRPHRYEILIYEDLGEL